LSSLDEDPEARSRKYIATLTAALRKTKPRIEDRRVAAVNIRSVADAVQRYLQDAEHYLNEKHSATSLACVAYAEGLFDALVFLELTEGRARAVSPLVKFGTVAEIPGQREMIEEERNLIKAAYIAQLKHGAFTQNEFGGPNMEDAITRLSNANHLQEQRGAGGVRYSLTEAGRKLIKVVLAGGVYDVLHLGHLEALAEAKKLGDLLVVVVATDATVENLKGRKPVFPEEDRRALVEGLKPVDKAILGYEDVGFGFEQVLTEVKPDIVAFGYDQEKLEKTVAEIIQRHHLNIEMTRLPRFEREKYLSSSLLRQRLSEELS
jgi:FAD synthetase